jgi:hypothetical protein
MDEMTYTQAFHELFGAPVANAYAESIQDLEQQLIAQHQPPAQLRFGPWPGQPLPAPPRPPLAQSVSDWLDDLQHKGEPLSVRVGRKRAALKARGINLARRAAKLRHRKRMGKK